MKKKTEKEITGAIILALIIGVFIGIGIGKVGKNTTTTKVVEKEVPVEKIVEKTVEIEKNANEWKKLKEIDDQGFAYSADFAGLCSQAFKAGSRLDAATIEEVAKKMLLLNPKMTETAEKRRAILEKLGY